MLELGLRASTDFEIFQWAQENQCIIVTFDGDFADRRNFGAVSHHGIIRLRIRPTTIEQTRSALDRLVAQTDVDDLDGAVVVVGRQNIRIRRPSGPDN